MQTRPYGMRMSIKAHDIDKMYFSIMVCVIDDRLGLGQIFRCEFLKGFRMILSLKSTGKLHHGMNLIVFEHADYPLRQTNHFESLMFTKHACSEHQAPWFLTTQTTVQKAHFCVFS